MKAANYKPASRADACQHAQFVMENFEPWDWPTKRRRRRRRRTSLAQTIRQARRAGDRGPVRVELPDGTIVTSSATEPHGSVETSDETPETLRKLIQ